MDVKENVGGFRLFSVYDGHAGKEAVEIVKKILPEIMARHLEKEANVESAIHKAFEDVDGELTKTLLDGSKQSDVDISSGAVACIALLKQNSLWIANLGDCRAVLCTEGHKPKSISSEHSPEKNRTEAERLQALGVQVCGGYVGNHVAVSRAFGNVGYDSGKKVDGIIHDPDVYQIEVDEDTDFLVLGSDGVWDALKDQFVVTHARKALRSSQKPEDAAVAIVENAAKVSRADNAAAVVVVFKFPEPLPKRRVARAA